MRLLVFLIGLASCAGELRLADGISGAMSTDDRIAVFARWLKSDASNGQTQNLLAAAYIQKTRETADPGYLQRADALVASVMAREPRNYEAWRLRNLIELNRHHFAQVEAYATEMSEWAPRDAQNWGTLGDALMELGKYDEAVRAYNKMAEIRVSLFSLNRLAYYRFIMGDAEGAITAMRQAVAAGAEWPENKAWCLAELGWMYFKLGRMPEAERAFRDAADGFPGQHQAHAGLGAVLAARGETGKAIESYLRAQAIVPLPQYAGALAELYTDPADVKKQNDRLDLIAGLEEAAGQKANRTLALMYANQGRHLNRALELARADLEVRRDIYTWDALGWVLFKTGDVKGALKAAHEAIRTGAKEPLLLYHAGMIELAAQNQGAARRLLEKALALNPRFDPVQAGAAGRALRECDMQADVPSADQM